MICREKDMKGGLSGHLFLCLPISKTMAHQSCPAGSPKAVLCAIRNISLGVEHEMWPGGVFGEGWVCHCLGGRDVRA